MTTMGSFGKRLCARLPLYARFLVMSLLAPGAYGLAGPIAKRCSWAIVFGVLFRRWLRCARGLPSRLCCSGPTGASLTPTMEGLHRRLLELYSSKPDVQCAEAAAEAMLWRVTLKDGQEVAFWDIGPRNAKRVVFLINGLGARIGIWTPLFDALHRASIAWKDCRVVVPEYRGQFASTPLNGCDRVSVERSAEDVAALAESLGVKRATLLCWSTGVQVGLQVAILKPNLVEAMILIQGFYPGELLESLAQPICAVPFVPTVLAVGLGAAPAAMRQFGLRRRLHAFISRNTALLEFVGRHVLWFFGTDLIAPIAIRYAQDMLQSDAHFTAYCGYAEALSRHKISDRLPDIEAPALVVTGTPDFVTPARCSYDLAAMLGGRSRLVDDIAGSHYYILEEPHKLAVEIAAFLNATS